MIISWDEYSEALKEISKLKLEVKNLEEQKTENQYHFAKIIEIAYSKLQCKQRQNYPKKLHTNQVLKRILYHISKVKQ